MLSDIWDSLPFRYFRAAFVISILIYALIAEPSNLQLTENTFDVFTDNGSTITIVLISDMHGSYQDYGYFPRVIEMVNSQEPDLILIAGDNVGGGDYWAYTSPLEQLKSTHGIYAVLGNHDYEGGNPDNVEEELEAIGIEVLRNEHRILDIEGREFALIGLEDLWVHRSNYSEAAAGVPANMTKVILAHNYLSAENQNLEGRNLVLSGHTHCGQVRIPFITSFLLWLGNFGDAVGGRFTMDENTEAYITCGVVPGDIRLFAPPEVSVIYLE